jgi:hypothetical protein
MLTRVVVRMRTVVVSMLTMVRGLDSLDQGLFVAGRSRDEEESAMRIGGGSARLFRWSR